MGRRKDNSSDQEPTPSDGESGPLWPGSEFGYLRAHDEQLVRLGRLADRYLAEHPGLALTTLTQFAELLARLMAAKVGMLTSQEEAVPDLLRRLQDHGILPPEVARLFYAVRRASHDAADAKMSDPSAAIVAMRLTQQLGLWFHRTFADPAFVPTPDAVATGAVPTTDSPESLAADIERGQPAVNARLAAQQARGLATPKADLAALLSAASAAAAHVDLDEFDTRKLIDQQLRLAGWTVDTATLTYSRGARPKKGKNLAIAEWPTENGPADYILFVGLTPVATVEAKRKNKDVSGCIQQAKRYSRGFVIDGTLTSPGGPWLQHKLPFVFSTNGRPYLRQLETRSGIWFCDVRLPDRLGHALDGWYTPEGLTALLKRDEVRAHQQLSQEPFAYGFTLRPYQQTAIQAVESAIAKGQRAILLAMATGTGKTKTCIALIYRLLKVQRFRRILFLVDRAALGEQAANAFKDTRMEGLQTFAETFGIKEFDEAEPESATVVHVATVQGMVKRILYCRDSDIPPAVDQYDCIIVDECHRGYLLDRELSDAEMVFRSHEDYISKYRRVLDYFDAVKVGLTATPALHTSEIFGAPVFHYTYREAVIDGFLVDHEPPVQIHTDLSQNGIVWAAGERVAVYHTRRNEVSLYTTPDEIKLEVEDFNRKVITEPWNRVVCEFLAREIDPSSRQKTLIFCANDAHADLVVKRLKLAFEARYGAVEDDAVIKITGAADKPLQLIRRYKNERQPSVAVTVDLLTTGVDVPEICNLVFLRRVNSRILFDQMLGRATRLCDKIGKATFRIFDAVRIYEALQPVTAMQPVVVDPTTRFVDLARITKGQKRGPSAQVRSVPYLRVANVQRGRLDLTSIKEIEATEEEIYELRLIQGDLLCTEGGDRDKLGRGWVWNDEIPECIHQNHIFRARLGSQGLNAKYVSWYCNQVGAEYFLSQAKQTTNLASINITKLGQLPIALAPVNEQKRIADKLNSLLARVDACRERLDRVPGILKRFRQAVLAAATSGELTREWREANGCAGSSNDSRTSLPPGWSRCAVGRFAECLDRLRVPIKKDNRKNLRGLYPYYGANGEVGRLDEYIFDDELVLVTEDETFYGREKPIAYRSSGKCWVNNHAHVLRAQDVVSTDYLCYSLMYYNVEPWLSGTTGRAKLTQKALLELPINIPPKNEMKEAVVRIKRLFDYADRLLTMADKSRPLISRLTPSLLSKAFRGELVPQDPNDEPASELLARIRAAGIEPPTVKRGRKAGAR